MRAASAQGRRDNKEYASPLVELPKEMATRRHLARSRHPPPRRAENPPFKVETRDGSEEKYSNQVFVVVSDNIAE